MNRKVLKFVCEITFDTGFPPQGGGQGEGAPLKQFALPSKTFAPPPQKKIGQKMIEKLA